MNVILSIKARGLKLDALHLISERIRFGDAHCAGATGGGQDSIQQSVGDASNDTII